MRPYFGLTKQLRAAVLTESSMQYIATLGNTDVVPSRTVNRKSRFGKAGIDRAAART